MSCHNVSDMHVPMVMHNYVYLSLFSSALKRYYLDFSLFSVQNYLLNKTWNNSIALISLDYNRPMNRANVSWG